MTAPKSNSDEPLAPDETTAEPRRMTTPYQRLIYNTIRAKGMDYSEVARKAGRDPKTGKARLTRQRVQQIVSIPIKRAPSPVTIRGLAVALELPEDTIREHVSETLGLRTLRDAAPAEFNELLDMVERLDAADRDRWLRLSQVLVRDLARFPSGERATTGDNIVIGKEQAGELTVAFAQVAGDESVSPELRGRLQEFAETIFHEQTG